MEILVALGNIYGAEKLIKVGSVQVAGVSYHNLGDAGLEFLNELAKDGKVKVLTTLNPAGMEKTWNRRRVCKKTESSYRRFQEDGNTHLLHLHTLPDR